MGIHVNPKKDIETCRETIVRLREHKTRSWAIGLRFKDGQPDAFFTLFAERGLACSPYLRGDFSVGSAAAYDENIARLEGYIAERLTEELVLCKGNIARIQLHREKDWAIGLRHKDGQPDSFTTFFALRGLPIAYYARGAVSTGDPGAYEKNAATLEGYLTSLGQ